MFGKKPPYRNPWAWVPTLYYAAGNSLCSCNACFGNNV